MGTGQTDSRGRQGSVYASGHEFDIGSAQGSDRPGQRDRPAEETLGPNALNTERTTFLIGVSAPHIVSQDMIRSMAPESADRVRDGQSGAGNLNGPTRWRRGPKVIGDRPKRLPNQINNVLAFPGHIFKGALVPTQANRDQRRDENRGRQGDCRPRWRRGAFAGIILSCRRWTNGSFRP